MYGDETDLLIAERRNSEKDWKPLIDWSDDLIVKYPTNIFPDKVIKDGDVFIANDVCEALTKFTYNFAFNDWVTRKYDEEVRGRKLSYQAQKTVRRKYTWDMFYEETSGFKEWTQKEAEMLQMAIEARTNGL